MMKRVWPWCRIVAVAVCCALGQAGCAQQVPHNVIIFVADGLRHGSVDDQTMPTFARVRREGVDFVNSHSLFPTFTTPNASAIATGHYLGDTGDFSNDLYTGNPADVATGVESDVNIPLLNAQFEGNYLGEETLLSAARKAGFQTAVIGKTGPALVQDVTRNNAGTTPENIGTIVMDDSTGHVNGRGLRTGVPLEKSIREKIMGDAYFKETYLKAEGAVGRGAAAGEPVTPGSRVVNGPQAKYLADVATKAILPRFVAGGGAGAGAGHKPFVMVFWSREPDITQHNNQENVDKIVPGINNGTVKRGLKVADDTLKTILDYLRVTPDTNVPGKMLIETTDVFITSDHGFGTLTKKAMDVGGTAVDTFAAKQRYRNVQPGYLPVGFVSVDLAHDLGMPLFDGDAVDATASREAGEGVVVHRQLRIESGGTAEQVAQSPGGAAGLLGSGVVDKEGYGASAVVVGNLVWVPARPGGAEKEGAVVRKIVASLLAKPYVSGVFVDGERFGEIDGTLPLSAIGLKGAARTPVPAVVINFRSFATDPSRPEMTGVEFAETTLRQGQGMHGSFGRHVTYNCMMAIGPDFKAGFVDGDPVSNADIAMTLSKVIGVDLMGMSRGPLHGRVISEALAGGPAAKGSERKRMDSAPGAGGEVTSLLYQVYLDEAGREYRYFDAGGFAGRTVGLEK